MTVEIDYGCRWEEVVQTAIDKLGGGEKVMRVEYEADFQGFLDIDVLLNDGRVMSVIYYYGSCSVCDPWEDSSFDTGYDSGYPALADHIIQEATFFDDVKMYEEWRKTVPDRDERSID